MKHPYRTVGAVALALAVLFLLAILAGPRRVGASGGSGNLEIRIGIATTYGQCCTGDITRPGNGGTLQSEPFQWDRTMVVATSIYPRGTPICVRWIDELACRDERGVQLMAGDYCPECNGSHIDVSFAIVRDRFGFCGEWDYRTCAANWGRQDVTWWVPPAA